MSAEIINLDAVRCLRQAAAPQPQEAPAEAISCLRRRKPLTSHERQCIADIIKFCRAYPEKLSRWERGFLDAIAAWRWQLSDRQRQALDRTIDKVERFASRRSS